MDDIDKLRTPEQEVLRFEEKRKSQNSTSNLISDIGLAKYFNAALEQLNFLQYGDPSEYLFRIKNIDAPSSPLDLVWVPPRFRQQEELGDDIPFDIFLEELNQCKLVLADPGCGKSTLARFLTCLSIKRFRASEQNYFGILVPLSTIKLTGKTYDEAIAICAARYVGLENDKDVVAALVHNINHACIIFDGFDELPINNKTGHNREQITLRREVASMIRSLLWVSSGQEQTTVLKKFIVTCRTKEYSEDANSNLSSARKFFMSKFSPAQMNLAVQKWHDAAKNYAQNDPTVIRLLEDRKIAIQGALRENSDLGAVCLTPLMLSALQTVYSDSKDLPSSVSQLCWRAINWFFIEKYFNTLEEEFVKENGVWFVETIVKVAWNVHERVVAGRSKSFDNLELRKVTGEICPLKNIVNADYETKENAITKVVSFLRGGHGIFARLSQDEFDFVHNIFREVLAGRALGNLPLQSRCDYALNELWHGPIRYWAGLKAAEPAGLHEISAFVGELSFEVNNNNVIAILASGEMLVEVCSIIPANQLTRDLIARVSEIRNKFCSLLQRSEISLSHRLRIGDLLATLGDPRLNLPVLERVQAVAGGDYVIGRKENHVTKIPKYEKCPASPQISGHLTQFDISAFLVTNKEFGDFINAGGYNTKRYWPNDTGWKWAQKDKETVDQLIQNARDVAKIHFSSELAGQRIVLDEIPELCVQMIDRKLPMYWADPANNRANQPIVGVNWWEAIAYCLWLEENLKKTGILEQGKFIRLPIEAEWEAAAQQCGNNTYPWTAGEPSECALVKAAFNRDNVAPIFRSCGVGLFESVPTNLKVFDLVGNVWEWTSSKAEPYNSNSFNQRIETGGLEDRISRGSSWLSSEEESTQITFRSFDPPYNAYEDLGFRIVITN